MNDIKMIPVDQLVHHPENPRLEIGDISELTASIKANGILQNLTVVFEPAHKMSPHEWEIVCSQYRMHPDEALRDQMNKKELPDRYLVVIGNRRLEAARAAGLTELPCAIRVMDHNEQVATMLQENMQRTDLTLYEQAKGIQLMMDLGFSREEISAKTGFSKSTIERRLAVASLPDHTTKVAVKNGFDLVDLVEISKIENPETQQSLLEMNPAERDIRHEITVCLKEQIRKKRVEQLLPDVLKVAAKEVDRSERFSSKYEHIYEMRIDLDDEDAKVKAVPDRFKDRTLYYFVGPYDIEFYAKTVRSRTEKTAQQIALEKKQHDAKELNQRMRERIGAFIQTFNPTKKMEALLKDRLFYYSLAWRSSYGNGEFYTTYHHWENPNFRAYVGMPMESDRDMDESIYEEMERRGIPMGRAVLALMMSGMLLNITGGYCSEYNATYREDNDMDRVYEVLEEIGYQMSEEESQWRDGTHQIYGKTKEDDDGEETGDDD